MTERLEKIFGEIPSGEIFADIACDHGYIAFAMLKSGKCKKAFAADVSERSLSKAEKLLKEYIAEDKCRCIVSDGFKNVPKADVGLVAGIGGILMIEILSAAAELPEKLVLQPMKHCEKVRRAAVKLGYFIKKDFTIKAEGQFYDIIVAEKGKDFLTEEEAEFGRTNVEEYPQAFKEKIACEIKKLEDYCARENISETTKTRMIKETERLKKYV